MAGHAPAAQAVHGAAPPVKVSSATSSRQDRETSSPGLTFAALQPTAAPTPLFGSRSLYHTPGFAASALTPGAEATSYRTPAGPEPTPDSFIKLPDGATAELEASQLMQGQQLDVSPLTGLPVVSDALAVASSGGIHPKQGPGQNPVAAHIDEPADHDAAASKLPRAPKRAPAFAMDSGNAARRQSSAMEHVHAHAPATPGQPLQATTPMPTTDVHHDASETQSTAPATAARSGSRDLPHSAVMRNHQHEPTPPGRLNATTPLPAGPMPSQVPLHGGSVALYQAHSEVGPAVSTSAALPAARTSPVRTAPAAQPHADAQPALLPLPSESESPYIAPRSRPTPRSNDDLLRQSMSPRKWRTNVFAAELKEQAALEGQGSTGYAASSEDVEPDICVVAQGSVENFIGVADDEIADEGSAVFAAMLEHVTGQAADDGNGRDQPAGSRSADPGASSKAGMFSTRCLASPDENAARNVA